MKIFIDESGDFGWSPPGVSLFCATTVADRTLDNLFERFSCWQRKLEHEQLPETKGKDLLPWQQALFAQSVILTTEQLGITLAGTNTTLFPRRMAERFKQDSARTIRACAKSAESQEKPKLVDFYRAMANWIERRSPENVLWVCSLIHIIPLAIQHAIVQFAEEEDDCEFENIEILMDRSFISKHKHDIYWREWLRNALLTESQRQPMLVIKEWSERNHPFVRKYRKSSGIIDWSDLFRNNMHFVNSKDSPGVQIADLCANIAFRHFARKAKYRPYRLLRSRVRGKHRTELHLRIIGEESLLQDAPENHIYSYSDQDLEQWAEIARKRATALDEPTD